MNFDVAVRQLDSAAVVDVEGHITHNEGTALGQTVRDLVKKGHEKIVLNLRGVKYLDSSGIGELVKSYSFVKKHGGELKTIFLTPRVKEIFELTNLSSIFEDYEDVRTAIRSFA